MELEPIQVLGHLQIIILVHIWIHHIIFTILEKDLDYSAEDFVLRLFTLLKKFNLWDLFTLTINELDQIPSDIEFLIIKTGYGKYREIDKYHNDNPGLHSSLANELKDRFHSLRAVGFDFISLTSWNHRDHGKVSHFSILGDRNNF